MDVMIEAQGIKKAFGKTLALTGVDLIAETGKVGSVPRCGVTAMSFS